jgi:DNA-binding PadR family transcriptional regulator
MTRRLAGGTIGIFGSRVRAQILGYLAQASDPRTGYSIAKDLQIGVSNVYPELKQLEAWSIIASRPDKNGRRVFELADEDLRRFLLRRVRVISSQEWFSSARIAQREAQSIEAIELPLRVSRVRSNQRNRPLEDEFRRPPEKDQALKRIRKLAGGAP